MSEPINDGGPAFPRASGPAQEGVNAQAHYGMTLRDWFAGQALAGLLASPAEPEFGASHFANAAYTAADAMLKARGGAQ